MTESSQQPLTFRCERCGRTAGRHILKCPNRVQGHCPYAQRDLSPATSRRRGLIGAVIGAALIVVPLILYQLHQVRDVGVFVFLAFWGFVMIILSSLQFHTRTLLYNPISGFKWTCDALLGITVKCTLILRGEQLQSEREILSRLSSRVAQQQPVFSEALDDEIWKAMRSRRHPPPAGR